MDKNTTLQEQVQEQLHKKGFSTAFNRHLFNEFKRATKKAFNQAHAIAELYINEQCPTQCDFNQYTF